MRFRTTYILLAILVALGAFVLLYERKLPAPDDANSTPTPTLMDVVLAFSTSDVQSIKLTRESTGQVTELVYRETGLWHVLQPTAEEADQQAVVTFLDSLATVRPVRMIEGASSPADYGLDPADIVVELGMKDGTQRVVKIGAITPAGSGYYGQVGGDARVYVLAYSVQYDVQDWLDTPPVAPTVTPTLEPVTPEPSVTPGS